MASSICGEKSEMAVAPRGSEFVERFDDVSRQLRVVELERGTNCSNIVGGSEQDVDPMDQLHIGVAAHLAEAGCSLDCFERCRIEATKQGRSADFRHCMTLSFIRLRLRGERCASARNPALPVGCSHEVQPRRERPSSF